MLVGALCLVMIVAAAVGWRVENGSPLDPRELLRIRRLWDRIHREEIFPFD